jgi:hypothetical protein
MGVPPMILDHGQDGDPKRDIYRYIAFGKGRPTRNYALGTPNPCPCYGML